MATLTANGRYKYDDIYYGAKLDQWVQEAHRANCKANGWSYQPLKKGAFGYDNIAVSLVYLFDAFYETSDNDELASAVHNGWCENYLYWRDNKPYLTNTNYHRPAKAIGDALRNKCAELPYDKLPKDEQVKDMVFVHFVKNRCLE